MLRGQNRDRTGENRQSFQKRFNCYKWIKKDSATICCEQNQNRPIRNGDTACQRFATSLRWAYNMTSRDVIGLPQVTISLATIYNNYCFLTVEDYTKDTREISGTQLPYRRRQRRIFVIIAPPVTLGGYAITFSPVEYHFFTSESFHRSQF